MAIDKKQIKKLAQEKIKLGFTKQTIYEELHQEYNGGQKIANIIQNLPSAAALKKYKFLHVLFLVLLSVLTFLTIITQSFAGIIWTAPMIFFVATHRARYYGWAFLAGLYGLIPGLQFLLGSTELPNTISVSIILAIGITIILISLGVAFLGFFLRGKLTPGYIEKKERYENSEGQTRLRLVFEFKD